MIRSTAISIVDQGLVSAINFLLALTLIRFASQEEYGLYTQLIGLQSLFSVLHAGLFVSAFLSLLPRHTGTARRVYQAGMARAEVGITLVSGLLVAVLTWAIASAIDHPIAATTSAAAALALLGLWWREFTRVRYFAEQGPQRALRLDAGYSLLVVAGLVAIVILDAASASAVLWCMGISGIAVAVLPITFQWRLAAVDGQTIRQNLATSWSSARWEVLTSLLTWGHAQTFVYFAAAQGGLVAAAQISAARLITMPLSLVWSSYANILRPEASRLLSSGDSPKLRRLAARSAMFALGLALAYGLALFLAMPFIEHYVFGRNFEHLRLLSMLWLLYFAFAGLTTIATSLLRSALEFRWLFRTHAFCAALAVAGFFAGLASHTPTSLVIVLIAVEALLAALCWWRLRRQLAMPASDPPALGRAQRA